MDGKWNKSSGGATYPTGLPASPQAPLTRRPPALSRLFRAFPGLSRWRERQPDVAPQPAAGAAFQPIVLGSYAGQCVLKRVFDGDISIDNISGRSEITLESRHGSIRIAHSIQHSARAQLKAAGSVTIGEGIERHSVVQIIAGGDVTIGQTISHHAQAVIQSSAGKIEIGRAVDDNSAARLTAAASVVIGQDIAQHSSLRITAGGDVTIGGSINQHATADIIALKGVIVVGRAVENGGVGLFTAERSVEIAAIGQEAQVTAIARGDVTVRESIAQHALATLTSLDGGVNIVQSVSGATASLVARNGSVSIGELVDRDSTVGWDARELRCPQREGAINHINHLA